MKKLKYSPDYTEKIRNLKKIVSIISLIQKAIRQLLMMLTEPCGPYARPLG